MCAQHHIASYYTATHCHITLQHAATHCHITLQHTATHCVPSLGVLLAVSVAFAERNVRATPYCAILHCNTPPYYTATHCNTLQHTAYPVWEFCSQCPSHSQREMRANASDCPAPSCAGLCGCGGCGCGVRVPILEHRLSRGDLYIHFI